MFLHPNFAIKRGEILKQIWRERIHAKFIRRYFCAFKCKFLGAQSLNAKQIFNRNNKFTMILPRENRCFIGVINQTNQHKIWNLVDGKPSKNVK